MAFQSRISLLFLTLGMAMGGAFGNMGEFHKEGKEFAQEFKKNRPKDDDLKDVPGYAGTDIEQATYTEKDLDERKSSALESSEAGKFIIETQHTRPRFDIDPTTDPLFIEADKIIANSTDELQVSEVEGDVIPVKPTIHKCLRGEDSFEKTCTRTLTPYKTGAKLEEKEYLVNFNITDFPFLYDGTLSNKTQNIAVERDRRILEKIKNMGIIIDVVNKKKFDINMSQLSKASFNNNHGSLITVRKEKNVKQQNKRYVEIKLTTSVEIPTYDLKWVDDCSSLEKSVDRGDCGYGEFRCVKGKETKMIEGVPLTADCWAEERVYKCHGNPKDTCQELAKKGCVQISSQCKTFDGKECVEWEQTYQCEDAQKLSTASLTGEKPYCLDGDCVDQSWAPNQDMADALSKLAIFQNIKKSMNPETKTVFGGSTKKCSRMVAGFKDCCQKKGWGVKIGLSSCKAKERELAEHRNRNKCIRVGTYCAKKGEFGVCLQKKTSFCCYPSKLARIINEQGEKQHILSFGKPRSPKCEGLTLPQLTKLDFEKIDLSELFQDVMAKVNIPNGNIVNEEVQKSMTNKKFDFTDKPSKITQGRSHDNF